MAPWLTQLIVSGILRKIKEKRMFKGKLTYGTLSALLVSVAASAFGDGAITAADLKELGEAALVLTAIYGRYRATKEIK